MLDYQLIKNDALERNIVHFDPKTAIKNAVAIFEEQVLSQDVVLRFCVKEHLSPPMVQGERS